VAKVVWGSLFVVMGVLFTLHDMGHIDLGEPEPKLAAKYAVDGNEKTRWSSAFRDPQWLTVDLGAVSPIGRIRLSWEGAFAKDYDLQVSSDGVDWTTVASVSDGDGGIDVHEVAVTGRWVRMMGTKRATPYGYSLWELQVFDPAGTLVSQGKPASASSLENRNPLAHWLRFWPLMLVASGLPLLLAPRDDANLVFGIVLTGLGAFLQLQRLGLVPWGFRETASALLIVIGLVILLQSRRSDAAGGETGPTGDRP
jgi:hypothetical protein